MSKPIFYQAVLKEVDDVLAHVYDGNPHGMTIADRMGSEEAKCPECGHNKWMLLAKESSLFNAGGKPYIECLECGLHTHL